MCVSMTILKFPCLLIFLRKWKSHALHIRLHQGLHQVWLTVSWVHFCLLTAGLTVWSGRRHRDHQPRDPAASQKQWGTENSQFTSNRLFSMTVRGAWKGNAADVRCVVGHKFSGRSRGSQWINGLSLSVPCALLRTSTWWQAAPLAWSVGSPARLEVLYFPVVGL